MSSAFQKNTTAVATTTGNSALASHLQSRRIGLWSEQEEKSGILLAEALGDVLGRFWQQLDASGPLAAPVLDAARSAAASGEQSLLARQQWAPPYDFVIGIGATPPAGSGPSLRIGASGWLVTSGSHAMITPDANPVGPTAAAALAAAEVFKALFADALGEHARRLPEDFSWSAWDYGQNLQAPALTYLHMDDVHIFGVGAVSHGLLWLLERWPQHVRGELYLIDQDSYDCGNGQRYAGMRPNDIGLQKPQRAALRLRARHPDLNVHAHDCEDMNTYYERHRPDYRVSLAVAGMDSPEHRRQLALKLPRRAVNMWTERERLGAARFGFGDGWPCLYCAYPEPAGAPLDETGRIVQETGLQPVRVRELLFSGAGITLEEAAAIAQRYGLPDPQALVGKPLRSVRGVLCAVGRITLPETARDVDVPFAFASLLAGVAGFVELVKEISHTPSTPGHWQFNVLHCPLPGHGFSRGPSPTCYLCSDPLTVQVFKKKYGT